MAAKKTAGGKKTQSALIVWGGWTGHEPQQCAERFAPWLKQKGFKVTVSETLDAYLDKKAMAKYSVIVPLWTMGRDHRRTSARVCCDAVLKPAPMHRRLARRHVRFVPQEHRVPVHDRRPVGGSSRAASFKYRVNITDPERPDHPQGLSDFGMVSEQYYMHTDPSNEVLATTTFSGQARQRPRGSAAP
jgi:uncharacterized protein